MALPDFTWCPSPGLSIKRTPRLVIVNYGDGYTHRITPGINPMEGSVSATFSGAQQRIVDIDAFLQANFLKGFTWTWLHPTAMYTCDTWQLTWSDKSNNDGLIGSLQAEFARAYNVQPVGP